MSQLKSKKQILNYYELFILGFPSQMGTAPTKPDFSHQTRLLECLPVVPSFDLKNQIQGIENHLYIINVFPSKRESGWKINGIEAFNRALNDARFGFEWTHIAQVRNMLC